MTSTHPATAAAALRGCALAILLSTFGPAADGQVCGVPGKDGGTVTPVILSGIVNTYYPSTASVAAGGTLIPVDLPSPGGSPTVSSGDLLLVLQVQGAPIDSSNGPSYGDGITTSPQRGFLAGGRIAGTHEFVVATGPIQTTGCPGGAARCLPINGAGPGLLNAYRHRNTPSWDRYQVLRVPQVLSARLTSSLTALPWNGSVGGVLAVDVASTLDLNGAAVDVSGLGFRGGAGRSIGGGTPGFSNADLVRLSSVLYHASKGEGYAGSPRFVHDGAATTDLGTDRYPGGGFARGAPGNAGGGGNDWVSANSNNSGGGGGGNGGDGGRGGFSWSSAQNVGGLGGVGTAATLADRLFLGGGAGAGTSNNAGPGHGGVGGGIVHIRADQFINSGTWIADGTTPVDSRQDGAGGGGAGGTVSIAACNGILGTQTVRADGADGGDVDWNPSDPHGPGGGGGGGIVLSSLPLTSTSVAGGAPGTTPVANTYGALAGSAGDVDSSISPLGPGANPGCECLTTDALVTDAWTGSDAEGPYFAWTTSSESGTAGYSVATLRDGRWTALPTGAVPAPLDGPGFHTYRVPVDSADGTYGIFETTAQGRTLFHGPYSLGPDDQTKAAEPIAPGLASDGRVEERDGRSFVHHWPMDPSVQPTRRDDPRERETDLGADGSQGRRLNGGGGKLKGDDAEGADVLRLHVRGTGWYRLPGPRIAAALRVSTDSVSRWIRSGDLRLENQGRPVAWTPEPGGTGLLFFGQGPDELGEPLSVTAPENVYWLKRGKGVQMPQASGLGTDAPPRSEGLVRTFHFEEQRFPATAAAVDPDRDFWFWGGAAAGTSFATATATFDLPGLREKATAAELTVHLQGANATGHRIDHVAEIRVNGRSLGHLEWGGRTPTRGTFELPRGVLAVAGNVLEVEALLPPGLDVNFLYLDRFEVQVEVDGRLVGPDLALPFEIRSPGRTVDVATPGASGARVFETSNPRNPTVVPAVPVRTQAGAGIRFRPARGGTHWVVPDGALLTPAALVAVDEPQRPRPSKRRANLLIVTAEPLRGAAEAWARYRQSTGFEVEVAYMEQLYDLYTHGIATPEALRALLRESRSWGLPPRYVLLLGDGHFDYRDHWGTGGNWIPPALVATADGLFASDPELVRGLDGAPAVGRIPATTGREALAALDKVMAYEASGPNGGRALLVADDGDRGGAFEPSLRRLGTAFAERWSAEILDLAAAGLTPARSRLGEAFGENFGWIHFYGHGGLDRLAAEGLLTLEDLPSLPARATGPVLTALTCNAGRFEFPGYRSLAGALVTEANRGAAAALSVSGLAYHSSADALGLEIARRWNETEGQNPTLGDAFREAGDAFLSRGGDPAYLRLVHLFGDPAMRAP